MTTTGLFQFLKRKEIVGFILAFCCTYFLFPFFFDSALFPVSGSGPSWLTLDPSWQITLNKINIDNLTWGKDFIFTYGPLSYLSTRVGWGESRMDLLCFDLFMSLNFFCVFYLSYIHTNNRKTTSLLILASTFILPVYFGSGNALILSAFLLFWIRKSLDSKQPLFYVMQILLIVLLFFIKFNTGLISFIFFFAGIIYKLFFPKENKSLLAVYAISPFVLIFFLSFSLNVSIPDYLKGGLEMVSGYNDIMYLDENYANEFGFTLVILLLAGFILLRKTWLEKETIFKNMVVLFLFTCTAYILYKQAFTRADIHHILEFYTYILLFILCIQDFHFNPVGKHPVNMLTAIIFIAVFFCKRKEDTLFMVDARITKSDYIAGFKRFTDTSGVHLFPNDNQVPQAIKEKIGKNTVDVYPWNTHLLFENRLNYSPRPVFQSYTAYTAYLENLNFNFYNSSKAPKYVIYEYDAIDGRYPLFDEAKLNLVLLKNYACVDTFRFAGRPQLVLERKSNTPTKIGFEKLKEYEAGLSDAIVPEAGKYYELFASNSLKGKIVSLFSHAPDLSLVIKTTDGTEQYYKSSKKMLEAGIFSDHFFNSTMNFYSFIKNDSLGVAGNVAGYRLQPKDPSLFNDKIKVIEYKIN